ncbi:MAG: patatin-like phospholipase family protein [Rhodospirillales bacterium]|nr:MAG: patatin-like phospholipase family protein [Rhodospirillales bacterium]
MRRQMPFRILALMGGGAKGVFSLGVLTEVEAVLGSPLCKHFDLIAGTSTGAIIGSLLSLGWSVNDIAAKYQERIPWVLGARWPSTRSARLAELASDIFGHDRFDKFQTKTAIVTTNLTHSRPTVFKSYTSGAWAGSASFQPGFGRTIGEVVTASCSAYPYFHPVALNLAGSEHELIDGGFSANDPSLFAFLDANGPLGQAIADVKLLTVGTGRFATKAPRGFSRWIRSHPGIRVFETTLQTTAITQEFFMKATYPQLQSCRIPFSSTDFDIHTDLLETNSRLLDRMFECGRTAFRESEEVFCRVIL